MGMIVDRPHPVDYSYKGTEAKIGFVWGSANDPVPVAVRIDLEHPDGEKHTYKFSGNFSSLEDAIQEGKLSIEGVVDRALAKAASSPESDRSQGAPNGD